MVKTAYEIRTPRFEPDCCTYPVTVWRVDPDRPTSGHRRVRLTLSISTR